TAASADHFPLRRAAPRPGDNDRESADRSRVVSADTQGAYHRMQSEERAASYHELRGSRRRRDARRTARAGAGGRRSYRVGANRAISALLAAAFQRANRAAGGHSGGTIAPRTTVSRRLARPGQPSGAARLPRLARPVADRAVRPRDAETRTVRRPL